MSFFSTKNKLSYTLIISLKSSSIDLQLMSITDQNKREILFFERSIMLLENSQDPQLYTSEYSKELTNLFSKNHTKIKQIIQNSPVSINFILYAPWFTSSIISITHNEPSIIDEEFLSKKIQDIKTDKKLYNLEKQIIKIEANGYTLNHLPKSKCSNIHLKIYSSYISETIHSLLLRTLQNFFPQQQNITYTTSPLLISNQIKRFMIREDNIVFLYIDSEITQIGIIEDDSLSYFVTFPVGKHDFLREIQTNIKTYDYDLLYQKEIQIKSKKQEEQLVLLKKRWVNLIIESLNLYKKNIPNKILIITDSKTKNFFSDLLAQSNKENPENALKNNRFVNFDISLLKDIITYKTPTGENELDLKLEALI